MMVQSRPVPMALFALVTISPVILFALAIWAGGLWPLSGLLYMTVLAATLDQIGALFMGNAPEGAEFPSADALLVLIAVTALFMLPLTIYAVAGSDLSPAARVFLLIGVGLWLGQGANPAAPELIPRSRRGLFRRGLHPYMAYFLIAALALWLAYDLAGVAGMAVWAGLALHAQSQLLLSDYVQHYGLTRARRPDWRPGPVADRHSWNAPFWFTSALMLNAPRHSDHNAHPDRPYPALRLPDAADAPRLPWSLPVACVIALVPPLWRRAIRPALAGWKSPTDPQS